MNFFQYLYSFECFTIILSNYFTLMVNNNKHNVQMLFSALHAVPHTHVIPHVFLFLCHHSTMVALAVAKLLRDCKNVIRSVSIRGRRISIRGRRICIRVRIIHVGKRSNGRRKMRDNRRTKESRRRDSIGGG